MKIGLCYPDHVLYPLLMLLLLLLVTIGLCYCCHDYYSLSGFLSPGVRSPSVMPWIRIHASHPRGLVAFSQMLAFVKQFVVLDFEQENMVTHSIACRGDGPSAVKYGCSSTSDADGRLAGSYWNIADNKSNAAGVSLLLTH